MTIALVVFKNIPIGSWREKLIDGPNSVNSLIILGLDRVPEYKQELTRFCRHAVLRLFRQFQCNIRDKS